MNNLKKISIIILLLIFVTGCVTKTQRIYKQEKDLVDLVLTTSSHDKYLFLGEKYQYLFTHNSEVNKLNELFTIVNNAKSFSVTGYRYSRYKNDLKVYSYKNGRIELKINLMIEPTDEQLLSIVKLGFLQKKNGSSTFNGQWVKKYNLLGKLNLVNNDFKKNFIKQKLKNTYRVDIKFQDNYKIEEYKKTSEWINLLWLVVLL